MNYPKITNAQCPMPENFMTKIALVVKRQSVKHFLLCSEDRFSVDALA